MSQFNGKTGTALTKLRPAGTALIEGVRIDVVTFGEYVDEGTSIVVAKVEGNKVFVQKKP